MKVARGKTSSLAFFNLWKSTLGRNSGWIEFWGGAAGSDVTNADNGFHSLARQLRCNHFWNHISWSGCLATTWCHFFWQAESVRMWWWEGIISQTNWQVATSISITIKSPSFSLVVCENVNWALPSSCKVGFRRQNNWQFCRILQHQRISAKTLAIGSIRHLLQLTEQQISIWLLGNWRVESRPCNFGMRVWCLSVRSIYVWCGLPSASVCQE